MARRSTPSKVYDEAIFSVRVRFVIPEHGFTRLNEAHEWLRQRTNLQYAIHGATCDGKQAAFLHVNNLAIAVECVKLFEMQLAGLPKLTP